MTIHSNSKTRNKRRLVLETCEARRMLAVSLVADLNQQTTSANPGSFTDFDGAVYFQSTDAAHGDEIWRVEHDGSNARIYRDLVPGPQGSSIGQLTASLSQLFFTAEIEPRVTSLMATDGTPGNTTELARFAFRSWNEDRSDEPSLSVIHDLTIAGGNAYFMISSEFTESLWTSDGTPQGTREVTSFAGFESRLLTEADRLYIRITSDPNRSSLYVSDGSAVGTRLFVDTLGGQYGEGTEIAVRDETVFFQIVEDDERTTLFRADPTAPDLPATITPLVQNSIGDDEGFQLLTFVGDELYFTSADRDFLKKTDGTPDGTVNVGTVDRAESYAQIREIIDLNGSVILSVNSELLGRELWILDDSEEGISPLFDINPGSASAELESFTQLGSRLYFTALNDQLGRELWMTDGTPENTRPVRDIRPGTASSMTDEPGQLMATTDRLFFNANDGIVGAELWSSDGTSDGTNLVSDLNPRQTRGAFPHGLTVVEDELIFVANNADNGSELWSTSEPGNGIRLVDDGEPGEASRFDYLDEQIRQTEQIEFDVYPQVVSYLAREPAVLSFQGESFFVARDNNQDRHVLWKLSTPAARPERVANLRSGSSFTLPTHGVELPDRLVFTTYAQSGFELWSTDGTTAGTSRLRRFSNSPPELVALGGRAYFNGRTGTGSELWVTDGTAAGTQLVIDAVRGTEGAMPRSLTVFEDTLYYSAANPQHSNWQLWRSDGTSNGTEPVTDFDGPEWTNFVYGPLHANAQGAFFVRSTRPDTASRIDTYQLWNFNEATGQLDLVADISDATTDDRIRIIGSVNDTLLYSVSRDGLNSTWGYQLGRSDPLADLKPCPSSCQTLVVDNKIYFAADDGIHGEELWESNGTRNGTQLVADLNPGSQGSNPANLTWFRESLYFSARTASLGPELWRFFTATPGDANEDGLFNSSDLVTAFEQNKYEQSAAASWTEGDWNGDGYFDSSDLVAAFRAGNYSLAADRSLSSLDASFQHETDSDRRRRNSILTP